MYGNAVDNTGKNDQCNTVNSSGTTDMCNEKCAKQVPGLWGQRLHDSLMSFDPAGSVDDMLNVFFLKFEYCNFCIPYCYPQCEAGENCSDMIKLCRTLSQHYQNMATLIRRIYKARQCLIWLMKLDGVFYSGNHKDLDYLVAVESPLVAEMEDKQDKDSQITETVQNARCQVDEVALEEKWKKPLAEFQFAMDDLPENPCDICNILFPMSHFPKTPITEEIVKKKGWSEVFQAKFQIFMIEENKKRKTRRIDFPLTQVCKKCTFSLNHGEVPPLSLMNDFGVDEIPDELLVLNDFERLLIQLVKSFHTVIKLRPYSFRRGPSAGLVSAMKGLAIHLPIPIHNTLEEVFTTLPTLDKLNILIDGSPTKSGIIWRSVVDVKKVIDALHWLKANNTLYKNVEVLQGRDLMAKEAEWEQAVFFTSQDPGEMVDGQFQEMGPTFLTKANSAEIVSHSTVVPLQQNQPNVKDTTLYTAESIKSEPISDKEKNLDKMCFPHLFPFGLKGLVEAKRNPPVRAVEAIRGLLSHSDPRFRQDLQFLFFCLSYKDKKAIDQGIYCSLRATYKGEMTAGDLKQRAERGDEELESNISMTFRSVIGSKEYWLRVKSDLQAMVESYCSPTFFLTLSCAEYACSLLRAFMDRMNPHIPNKGNIPNANLCAADPVLVSKFFEHKFQNFFKKIIMAKEEGPLGQVEHYFWRREYQQRGAPHIHMLLWIKGAPKYGINSDEEIKEFLKDKITCELPDAKKAPNVRAIVEKYQMHKCTNSCLTVVKRNGKFMKRCRYGFPRRMQKEMVVNNAKEAVKSRDRGGKVMKLVEPVRTAEERNINDYNAVIAKEWGWNTDIQFVGENSGVLIVYLTDYTTKSEKNSRQILWESLAGKDGRGLFGTLKSFAMQSFKHRECGVYEAADKLLGHHMHGASEAATFLDARMPENRKRIFRPFKEVDGMEDDDCEVFKRNIINDYYPDRSEAMEMVCLFDAASAYEYRNDEPKTEENKTNALKNLPGYFHKRRKALLLKTPKIKPDGDTKEKYFYALLLQFKPWRNEHTDLLSGHASYEEAFNACKEDLPNATQFIAQREKILKAQELAQKLRETAVEEVEVREDDEEFEDENAMCGLIPAHGAMFEYQKRPEISDEQLEDQERKLNADQRRVYDHVVETIGKQLNGDENTEPIRLFVSGVAGTGKSFLIDMLEQKVISMMPKEDQDAWIVAVLAPTGLAAYNVRGQTLHRFFKLPVQHGVDPNYWKLDRDTLKDMRVMLKNLNLIIVDEISMVSNITLAMIHLRLDETFGMSDSNITFGGKNIIVFGDLLQLPPVNSRQCYEPINLRRKKHAGMGIPLQYNFWNEFKYDELVINMRQSEDGEYAQLLGNIRIGAATSADIEKLNSRLIETECDNYMEGAVTYYLNKVRIDGTSSLCIFPTNAKVDAFNLEALKKEGLEIQCITAQDSEEKPKAIFTLHPDEAHKKMLKKVKSGTKTSDTAGLGKELIIAIGARIMLIRNIDIAKGLANGSMGTLMNIVTNQHRYPTKLLIKFDCQTNEEHPTEIGRVTAEFEIRKKVFINRAQFPVVLAYAVTVHKCQGLSLDYVMLDIGMDIFAEGQMYVALSRARKLANVHLIAFEKNKILVSQSALKEYNRLRTEFTPHLTCFALAKKPTKKNWKAKKKQVSIPLQPKLDESGVDIMPIVVNSNPFLKFENSGANANSCYSNSLTQMLLQCHEFCTTLVNFPQNECAKSLYSLYDNSRYATPATINTMELRQNVDQIFATANQQDILEFWQNLRQKLPDEITEPFKFILETRGNCMTCNRETTPQREPSYKLIVGRPHSGKVKFSDLFKGEIREAHCENCKMSRAHQYKEILILPERNRYLVLVINIFDNQQKRSNCKISDFVARKQKILDHLFETVGAAVHSGQSTRAGHYKALVHRNNKWHMINDDKLDYSQQRFVNMMEGLYLLILKRI